MDDLVVAGQSELARLQHGADPFVRTTRAEPEATFPRLLPARRWGVLEHAVGCALGGTDLA